MGGNFDVNADSIPDIVLGAFNADTSNGAATGKAYVVFGSATPYGLFPLGNLNGNNGFSLLGDEPDSGFGQQVAGGPDINDDGADEVLIGARLSDTGGNRAGAAYLVYGRTPATTPALPFPAVVDMAELGGKEGVKFTGQTFHNLLGIGVSKLGNVAEGATASFAVGAMWWNNGGGDADVGTTYIVNGCSGNCFESMCT